MNPTDRELLELAAKAAGYSDAQYQTGDWMEVRYGYSAAIRSKKLYDESGSGYWNPLEDDGDALQLAVKLRIDVLLDGAGIQSPCVECIANTGSEVQPFAIEALDTGDEMAATRRAIVRAAAELGRAGP